MAEQKQEWSVTSRVVGPMFKKSSAKKTKKPVKK